MQERTEFRFEELRIIRIIRLIIHYFQINVFFFLGFTFFRGYHSDIFELFSKIGNKACNFTKKKKNTHKKKIILNRPISIQQPLFENIKQLRNSSEFPEYLAFQPQNMMI